MGIKKDSFFEKLKVFSYKSINYVLIINGITILLPQKYHIIKLPIFFICIIFSTLTVVLSLTDKIKK